MFHATVRFHPVSAFAAACVLVTSTAAGAQTAVLLPQTAAPLPSSHAHVDIRGAFVDSLKQLAIEHAIRVTTQKKTRRELGGSFWADYRDSLRIPQQWEDGDAWWVNYVGHPIHGAAAGYSWLDHEPGAPAEIGLSGRYWVTRSHALAWAAAYSTQFEFGPLSEASIGNVGLRPETTGWVDHVVTPVGAFGLIVAEDALDRFFVKWAETHTGNRTWRASLRMLFNPARTMANLTSGKRPWFRAGRSIDWRPSTSPRASGAAVEGR